MTQVTSALWAKKVQQPSGYRAVNIQDSITVTVASDVPENGLTSQPTLECSCRFLSIRVPERLHFDSHFGAPTSHSKVIKTRFLNSLNRSVHPRWFRVKIVSSFSFLPRPQST